MTSVGEGPETEPRTIALTGVGHGLGRALAEVFLDQGHTVAGCTLGPQEVTALGEELPAGHWRAVDVVDPVAVARWAREVVASVGVPDLLIASAGVIQAATPLWEQTAEAALRVLRVNLEGAVHTLRSFLPLMVARRHGVAVVLGSGMAVSRPAGFAPYSASKAGIEALVESVGRELPSTMAAAVLHPGLIRTRMLETVMSSEEVAVYPTADVWAQDAALFLLGLGPESNGEVIPLPGWG